jgi:serine/threonine-protein kinase
MKERFKTIDKDFNEGGFGKIIVVSDEILERKVAIKRLQYLDGQNKERFKKEAKILASLSHPNIPAIYDVEFNDSEMYIEFQFIEGINLREIINQKTYPSTEEARRWFSQISSALEYAHSKKIIHRDIKPENIIINNDRNLAYLVDFGIALNADDTRNIRERGCYRNTRLYSARVH